MNPMSVGIIGVGRLGYTLAQKCAELNILHWVVLPPESPRKHLPKDIPQYRSIAHIESPVRFCFLTVQDGNIRKCAQQLAETQAEWLSSRYVIHCSGAHSVDILHSVVSKGAIAAVLHPFQMFPEPNTALLHKIQWAVEVEPAFFPPLQDLVAKLDGSAFLLNSKQRMLKPLYHATAVVASNALITLFSFAQQLMDNLEFPEEKFLPPILKTAFHYGATAIEKKTAVLQFLTGPVQRGDIETIATHLHAFARHFPQHLAPYQSVVRFIAEHSYHQGLISEQNFRQIQDLLDKEWIP